MDPDAPQQRTGRVLQFKPRPRRRDPNWSPVEDLRKYASGGEDDFKHRMLTNVIVMVVVVLLIGCGVWLMNAIVQLRKNQDCALTGRRNCAPINTPVDTR
jgi:hypothetical protein